MTEIWLVRHGQTDWNIEGRWQGHADTPLNSTGVEQARSLAADLAKNGKTFQAIYSSDLKRAYTTALEIGKSLDLPVDKDRRLREINKGDWEGMLVSQVSELSTEATRQRLEDPLHSRAPGGELLMEVATRLSSAADDIAARPPAWTGAGGDARHGPGRPAVPGQWLAAERSLRPHPEQRRGAGDLLEG